MKNKKICFIAQFPPPMHGLSKAVETLYNSELNTAENLDGEFEFELKDQDDKVIQSKKNAQDGSVTFDTIEYTKTGTYHYTITEKDK